MDPDPLHGWTMARIDAMATTVVTAHPGWWTEGTFDDHKEAARAGITEALLAASAEPSPLALYRAGQKALRKWANDESRYRGRRAQRSFARYWEPSLSPDPAETATDRVMAAQLLARLTRRQRDVVTALALHGRLAPAAASLGITVGALKSHLRRARTTAAAYCQLTP